MGTAHGADDFPLELQVGQKISTPHPPCPLLDLWSKQCAILLGSGPENQICARTQSLHSMTWPYPCHQYMRAGDLVRGDTPRYVRGTWWCPKSSGVWAVLGAAVLLWDRRGAKPRQKNVGHDAQEAVCTEVLLQKFSRRKDVGPRPEHCSLWTFLHGKIFHRTLHLQYKNIALYPQIPPNSSRKKHLYKQYKGIRLSWHFVPMGIFLYLLAFNSTFNLILAFNSVHLLLACALLDICEDPRWVNHTQPHSLKLARLIVKGYKPDCYQEKNYLRQKFSYF